MDTMRDPDWFELLVLDSIRRLNGESPKSIQVDQIVEDLYPGLSKEPESWLPIPPKPSPHDPDPIDVLRAWIQKTCLVQAREGRLRVDKDEYGWVEVLEIHDA
jgi:hypothetical protein